MPEIRRVNTIFRPKLIPCVPIRVPDLGVVEDGRVVINTICCLFHEHERQNPRIDERQLTNVDKYSSVFRYPVPIVLPATGSKVDANGDDVRHLQFPPRSRREGLQGVQRGGIDASK